MTDDVLFEKADGVLTITLNRPAKKNAMTAEMYAAIAQAIEASDDDREVRAVLLQAAGDFFTAGNDVGRFAAVNAGEIKVDRPAGEPMLMAMASAKKPMVAAVHGRAIGVGFTMLLHFDLVYVAEDALLSCPFANLALSPEGASTILLPARIGHARAFQLFALGEPIDGRTAERWGLANAALPAAEVQEKARAAALALARKPAASLAVTKAQMRDPAVLRQRIYEEFDILYERLRSPEVREALDALAEKRPPDFSRF
jgi:enoyl-CoA hydratase/carnithine racemase